MKAKPALGAGMLATIAALTLAACCGAKATPASSGSGGDTPSSADASAFDAPPDAPGGSTDGSTASVVTSVKPPVDADACPASFRDAQKPRNCTFAVSPGCNYAEGACGCEPQRNCGGMQVRNTGPGDPGTWRCGSTDPRQLDPAGCPYVTPTAAAPCATADKYCFYGACSWAGTAATCSAGFWRLAQIMGPPPP